MVQAAKLGKTVAESARASKLGQALAQLGEHLAAAGSSVDADAKPGTRKSGGSLISRLLEVKLPKPGRKAKAEAGADAAFVSD
jgi:pilus assembly protein CpaE